MASLLEYVDTYALRNDIDDATVEWMKTCARVLQKFYDRPIELEELEDDLLNKFLKHLKEKGQSAYTVKARRSGILVLWRAAYHDGLTPRYPRQIRRIRCPETLKLTWSPEDMTRLLGACRGVRGCFRKTGIRRGQFFSSLVMAEWDTAFRFNDLLAMCRESIESAGVVRVVQNKTGKVQIARLRRETIVEINATFPPQRKLIWPLWARREEFYRQFRGILAAAGLSGSFKKIRKSSGTAVEKEQPGSGWKQLGNDPETARRWYINPEAYSDRPLPPPIDDL